MKVEQSTYTLHRLHRNTPGSSKYLDQAMTRIAETSRRFDSSSDSLVNSTWKLYAEGTPLLGLWVAVDPCGEIVGHALGDVEHWGGRMVAWVSQVVMDEVVPQALKHQAMNLLDDWVAEVNHWASTNNYPWKVSEIIMMSPRMTDAWARHSGFEPYRAVYRRLLH